MCSVVDCMRKVCFGFGRASVVGATRSSKDFFSGRKNGAPSGVSTFRFSFFGGLAIAIVETSNCPLVAKLLVQAGEARIQREQSLQHSSTASSLRLIDLFIRDLGTTEVYRADVPPARGNPTYAVGPPTIEPRTAANLNFANHRDILKPHTNPIGSREGRFLQVAESD